MGVRKSSCVPFVASLCVELKLKIQDEALISLFGSIAHFFVSATR